MRNPTWDRMNRVRGRAYQRAYRRLADLHRDQFQRLLIEERVKAFTEEGLTPASSDLAVADSAPAAPEAARSENGVVTSTAMPSVPCASSTADPARHTEGSRRSDFTFEMTNPGARNAGAVETTTA